MISKLALALGAALALACTISSAAPVAYGLTFHVQETRVNGGSPSPADTVYSGTFVVDDSILGSDGINKTGSVSAFRIDFGSFVWDMNDATSQFAGFRGPDGLGASSPGFDVVGGQITNLRGGVFGGADFPFVDFSTSYERPLGDPLCAGLYCGNGANRFVASKPGSTFWLPEGVAGSMFVTLNGSVLPGTQAALGLPEPAGLALFSLAGLAALMARHLTAQQRRGAHRTATARSGRDQSLGWPLAWG